MPTRTIDTQTFEGEQIQCAKFVSDEPFSWKAAQIVQAETDYEFQMVAKSSVATTLTIQVGDTVKTQAITTEFTRFVIPFPSVTNDVDSLYISFPAGTYWLYNLQLERASTPSAWRPAPEDAEDYADRAAQQAVDDQTQEDIFLKLTNNRQSQGIYLLDGQLYINGEYIAANTISGNKIHGGVISGTEIDIGNGTFVVDENGQVSAANIAITGGSVNITAGGEQRSVIKLVYSSTSLELTPLTIYQRATANSRNYTRAEDPYYTQMYYTTGTDPTSTRIIRYGDINRNGQGVIEVYDGGQQPAITLTSIYAQVMGRNTTTNNIVYRLQSSSGHGNLSLYDSAGVRRVNLSITGLQFWKSDGTLGNTYPA